jgi:pyridoxine kinase
MFPLQRLGAEVWAINTVQFSNHPGYSTWTGDVFSGESVRALVDGVAARGALARCDAVLSGYMGDKDIGDAILDAVARTRDANPRAVYCCDPVIGDEGAGIYVRPGIPALIRDRAIPLADIATPNRFELEHLTGLACDTVEAAKSAVAALQAMMRPEGPRAVLLTSLETDATPPESLDLLAAEAGVCHRLRTPKLALNANGAGDAIAALFLFHRLATGSARIALERAGSSIHGLLARTLAAGSRELLTVQAQQEFVAPSLLFGAETC